MIVTWGELLANVAMLGGSVWIILAIANGCCRRARAAQHRRDEKEEP